MYYVEKILNNNVVIAEKDNLQYILVGKGLGFGKKARDTIHKNDVERAFVSIEELNIKGDEIVGVSEEIIVMAEKQLGESLGDKVHTGLIDHIHFAINRIQEGINISNPFLNETKALYPVEFSIASQAVALLCVRLGIDVPQDEIGFIALHIRANRKNLKKSKV
ncbi:transcriptional antiterminator, BglG [Alkaliphilus metalliredigens QYMF]|uniref:Transcriptional antiterminator, BglG n=1 Tax=Alkaliphilus metalliredigens (strain QYMF) TaxID=293826 RepID=A6TMP5_ALKMQ|nr:PRD domain-containing protein [Alkaliphilus metalliredigens]ABR47463.1 transcriptional antiterminator, BglG [Alkaliphilus metalliredigens QYMF]